MSSPAVYVNYAGTMSESFAIGKRGVQLLQGLGDPTGITAPVGSLYLRKDNTRSWLYQMSADNSWVMLLTTDDVLTIIANDKFRDTFTNADLVEGVLTVTHNLNEEAVLVQVWNDSKSVVIPDVVQCIDENTIEIDLSSFGTLSGTWKLFITK